MKSKYTLNNLSILGGKKSITFKKPHWNWPPQSKEKLEAIKKYISKEKHERTWYPKIVEEFEKKFAKYQNRKFALTTNSGTSALYAAFFALNLKKGDEIIVPALTFHATASPLSQFKATTVICDCEKDTGNICPDDVEKKITKKTKVIVVTHLCGHPCDMDRIMKIKKKYNLKIVEDCSHAHGSLHKNVKVGCFGEIACFSLGQKIIASGEAGILVTNNKILFERALITSDFNQRLPNTISNKDLKKYVITGFGIKHRIHPLAAAIANAELKKLNFYIKKRNTVLNKFSKELSKIPGLSPPITRKKMHRGAFFCYRPFVDTKQLNNISIENFIKILSKEGMEVRRASHQPLHLLPLFLNSKKNNITKKIPNAEIFYETTITIPTFTFEKKELINQYLSTFKKVCIILNKNKYK